MLLRYLHLGVLLLLLKGHLLAVEGHRFPYDHATGGHDAASPLGESSAKIFLLAELLLFLERAELGGCHGLAVAQLNDAAGIVEEMLGLLLLRLRLRLRLLWELLRLLLRDLLRLLYFLLLLLIGLLIGGRLLDRS